MPDPIDLAITQRSWKSDMAIAIDFRALGARLTADGEVAVLGFVHYYLGQWSARAVEGSAPRPAGWPHLGYEYVPAHLTLPVIRSEAQEVAIALRSILLQPTML